MAQQLIISDPKIMMGQPVVAGTRITVDLILEKLSAGNTFEQLLQEHRRLTGEGIQAALSFAREAITARAVHPPVEDTVLALSRDPLELHADIVFTMCRVYLIRVGNSCSRLEEDDELKRVPDKRLELIEGIISDIGEVKKILWAAVEASRSNRSKTNSIPEGQL